MNFSDYSPLFTPRVIGIFALIVASAVALGIVLLRGYEAFGRYCTGWKALKQKFPARDVHKFGSRYKGRTGFFYGCGGVWGSSSSHQSVSGFLIELALEGLLVTANFDRSPILIPWSAICDVTERDMFGLLSVVYITVDYEKKLEFTIPKEALIAIQENVPPERLHKAVIAFSELIKHLPDTPQN